MTTLLRMNGHADHVSVVVPTVTHNATLDTHILLCQHL